MTISVLISFAYMSKSNLTAMEESADAGCRVMLDSGAFTAYAAGKPIDLDDYCSFVSARRSLFWEYVALDVVGSSAQTAENLDEMKQRGLSPMPVLTVDAHVDDAKSLTESHRSLCIAGGVTEPSNLFGPRIQAVRDRVGPDVWIHGLGYSRGPEVARSAADSVDSSSWKAGGRWGQLVSWGGRGLKADSFKKIKSLPWEKLNPTQRKALVGMGGSKLLGSRGFFSALNAQSTYAFIQYASFLKKRGITYIFAVVSATEMVLLLSVFKNSGPAGFSFAACLEDQRLHKAGRLTLSTLARQANKNAKEAWGL